MDLIIIREIWRCIKEVALSRTRNAVVEKSARGFESHHLRQNYSCLLFLKVGAFMNIRVLHMVEGAKQATGCVVIIDVFRAFSVEAYLMNNGAGKIIPVGDKQIAYDLKKKTTISF